MSRFEWILGAILAVLVVVIGGLLVIFWLQGRPDHPVNNSLVSDMTAKRAHGLAQPAAERWAADARLVTVQTVWQPGSDFAGGEASWSLTFYSPQQRATALFTVVNGQIAQLSSRETGQALETAGADDWQVDSPVVTELVLASGGREFMASQGDSSLVLTLSLVDSPTWTAILVSQETRRNLGIVIDAGSGKMISIQQSE
jgi:hypothetical protein